MPIASIAVDGDSVVLIGEGFPEKVKVTIEYGKTVYNPTKGESPCAIVDMHAHGTQ